MKLTSKTVIPLFVYGSLKRGFHNHHLLRGSQFVDDDIMVGRLYDMGNFPAMKEGTDSIFGELYFISEETLKRLDILEGHPTYYQRKDRQTLNGNPCWVYLFNHNIPESQYIHSGIWNNPLVAKVGNAEHN